MPKSLLVADDSVVIQKSVGITFAQEDFAITYVSNGADALAKAKQLKPDAILADIKMPMKDGYEVCATLKKDPQLSHIPVLLLAGTHEPFDENKGKAAGADGYIIKPFESQVLLDRVRELLEKKSAPAVSKPAPIPQPVAAPTPPAARPMAPKPPTPTPSSPPQAYSTIAAGTPAREAPMLDLDVSEPKGEPSTQVDTSFDFSFDSSFTAEEPVVDVQAVTSKPTVPPSAEAKVAAAAEETLPAGDFWDFSGDTTVAPTPTPEPEKNDWGTIAAGQPAQELTAPAAELAPEPESFDLDTGFSAASAAGEPQFASDTTFDLSSEEPTEAITPGGFSFGTPVESEATSVSYAVDEAPSKPSPASADLSAIPPEQIEAIVKKVFHEVVERIAWEVVPDLAEKIIKEELARLTQEK